MEDTSSGLVECDIKRARPNSAEDSADRKRRRVVDDNDEAAIEFLEYQGQLRQRRQRRVVADPSIQGLDSVIRSFEEEVVVPASSHEVLDQATGEASDALGYLLEASDDDLGLPPSFTISADESGSHEVSELPDISSSEAFAMPFNGVMPNYDDFDLGPEIHNNDMGNEEYLILGGLFDIANGWDVPEVTWRPEPLPARGRFGSNRLV